VHEAGRRGGASHCRLHDEKFLQDGRKGARRGGGPLFFLTLGTSTENPDVPAVRAEKERCSDGRKPRRERRTDSTGRPIAEIARVTASVPGRRIRPPCLSHGRPIVGKGTLS